MMPTTELEVVLPAPAPVGRVAELRLLERAPSEQRSPEIRKRLAALLLAENQFDRARSELELLDDLDDVQALFLMGSCELAAELEACNERAAALFARGAELARTETERADFLADHAKCLVRLGEDAAARHRLDAALDLAPDHRNAWKRLAAMELRTGHADRLAARTAAMIRAGVVHPGVLAYRTLALSASGRLQEAMDCQAVPQLTLTSPCRPPEGWETLEDFNADLMVELLAAAGSRRDHYGLASIDSLRVDDPLAPGTKAFPALLGVIQAAVRSAVRSVGSVDHPMAGAVPHRAFLRAWAVITDRVGFETWHFHPNGWLTGVYYVAVPDGLDESTGRAGCLEFGLPDTLAGFDPPAASPSTLIRPRPGLLSISPSHAYHRTHPHGQDGWRVCVAFDVVPLK